LWRNFGGNCHRLDYFTSSLHKTGRKQLRQWETLWKYAPAVRQLREKLWKWDAVVVFTVEASGGDFSWELTARGLKSEIRILIALAVEIVWGYWPDFCQLWRAFILFNQILSQQMPPSFPSSGGVRSWIHCQGLTTAHSWGSIRSQYHLPCLFPFQP